MPAIRSLRLAAAVAAVGLAVALAGCSGSSTTKATPSSTPVSVGTACTKSGSVSESVKVTGSFNATPSVTMSSPLKVSETQRTVVTKGKGEAAKIGSVVNVSFSLYDGTTDKLLTTTGYGTGRTSLITLDASRLITGFVKTLNCSAAGSRVVGVVPVSEGFTSDQATQLGISPKDTLVIVADIISLQPTKASGVVQAPVTGLPTVSDAADGTPTVSIPTSFKAPTTTQVATLIKGAGAVVAATDTVVIQYQGINLRTGKIFQQTWGASPYSGAANGFVPGFTKAIVGQTVGSQVLTVIPPVDGYGSTGQSSVGIKGTDTLIFVVDILASTPAATQ